MSQSFSLEPISTKVRRLKVILVPVPTAGRVAATLAFKAGSYRDPIKMVQNILRGSGTAHGLEHLIFEGKTKKGYSKVEDDFALMGGRINGQTDREYLELNVSGRPIKLSDYLKFLFTAAFKPDFDLMAAKLDSEKAQIFLEISEDVADIDQVMERRMRKGVLGLTQNQRISILGTRKSVEKMTIRGLKTFHRRHITPDNAYLIVAGLFNPIEVRESIDTLLSEIGDIPTAKPQKHFLTTLDSRNVSDRPKFIFSKKRLSPCTLDLNFHTKLPVNIETQAAVAVANQIINHRAFKALRYREDGTYLKLFPTEDVTAFGSEAGLYFKVFRSKVGIAAEIIAKEIERLKADRCTPRDLEIAKGILADERAEEFHNLEKQIQAITNSLRYNRVISFDQMSRAIEQVPIERIARVARKLYRPQNLTVLTSANPCEKEVRHHLSRF